MRDVAGTTLGEHETIFLYFIKSINDTTPRVEHLPFNATFPHMMLKEAHMMLKEAHMMLKEPHMMLKEAHMMLKEAHMMLKEPHMMLKELSHTTLPPATPLILVFHMTPTTHNKQPQGVKLIPLMHTYLTIFAVNPL